jgi:nucleoid DNA-binding protein
MTKVELIAKMAKDAKITKVAAGVVLESFMGNVTKARETKWEGDFGRVWHF